MTLFKKINSLGFQEYLNCYLVSKGGRDGYLFQNVQYKEYDINSPISKNKLNLMKKYFPSLKQIPNRQGVLLTKKQYTLKDIEDDSKLGKILGFPCQSLTEILKKIKEDDDLLTTYIDIIVKIVLQDKEENIINKICKSSII